MFDINATADLVTAESPEPLVQGIVNESRTSGSTGASAIDVDLDPLVATLTARATGADPAQVRSVVEGIAAQFDTARVRDFLPVLILKQAGDQLRTIALARTLVA